MRWSRRRRRRRPERRRVVVFPARTTVPAGGSHSFLLRTQPATGRVTPDQRSRRRVVRSVAHLWHFWAMMRPMMDLRPSFLASEALLPLHWATVLRPLRPPAPAPVPRRRERDRLPIRHRRMPSTVLLFVVVMTRRGGFRALVAARGPEFRATTAPASGSGGRPAILVVVDDDATLLGDRVVAGVGPAAPRHLGGRRVARRRRPGATARRPSLGRRVLPRRVALTARGNNRRGRVP